MLFYVMNDVSHYGRQNDLIRYMQSGGSHINMFKSSDNINMLPFYIMKYVNDVALNVTQPSNFLSQKSGKGSSSGEL